MSAGEIINVLVVDDHELVRTAVEHLLNANDGMRVIGVAGSGEDALHLLNDCIPDVVLMDIDMPGMGGIEASRRALQRFPELRIIALSVHGDGPLPQQLLQIGVHGYLSKSCPANEMISAIQLVFQGRRYLSTDVASNIALGSTLGHVSPFERLSQREMEVVMLTLQGASISEIGQTLVISPKTVNTYRYRIYDKIGIKNDVELTRLAAKYKLIKDFPTS